MEYKGLYIIFRPNLEDRETATDILVSELAEIGFESFVENEDGLEAFITSDLYDVDNLPTEYFDMYAETWKIETIQQQNWNQTWEDNYAPVLVDDLVYVHAHFHPEKPEIKHQIRITPKMSFGTGHHATTELVMRHLLENDMANKTVLDMGTGTGILAILAHQLGASDITATEIEDFALENCEENFVNNGVFPFRLHDVRNESGPYGKFDVIIANITRNTLISVKDEIAVSANPNSVLIISGFYTQDREDLIGVFGTLGFENPVSKEKDNWVSIKFTKKA